MTLKSIAAALVIFAALTPIAANADGDPEAGKQKAQLCAACHGPDGNSVNAAWPNLAGQGADYLRKQLQDFRLQKRTNEQMSPMAANLSDADIADLAAYFAGQKPKIGAADPAKVEKGQRLYRAGNASRDLPACMACHGPTGAGNPAARYPAVHGQHADYTVAQLEAFRSEKRTNDDGAIMRSIASKMRIADIKAVASYIQGLH
jgi:cytochrome c553